VNEETVTFRPLLLLYSEKGPFSCIDLSLSGEQEKLFSSIEEVTKKIKNSGLEILGAKGSYRLDGSNSSADLLIAVRGEEEEVSKISEQLRSLDCVTHSSVSMKFDGFCYSRRLFPIDAFGLRWVMMGPANYEAILLGAKKILGSQIFPYFQRKLGNQIGENLYDYYIELTRRIESFDEAMSFLSMMFSVSGWGILETWKVDQNGVEVTLRDYWEVQFYQAKMVDEKPRILLGLLEGFFKNLLRREEAYADLVSVSKEGKSLKVTVFVQF